MQKINECNASHEQSKEEKSYDHMDRCRKITGLYSIPIRDRSSQKTGVGGEGGGGVLNRERIKNKMM